MPAAVPEIFDRALRRCRRDRAAMAFGEHAFLIDHIVEELVFRLEGVTRRFAKALVIGGFDGRVAVAIKTRAGRIVVADAGFRFARMNGGVQCDEDRLPFADGVFDLIVSAGVLDGVNDLPGALLLARRALAPDGLFLAGFVGAGSLPGLRAAAIRADSATGAVPPRVHPQIDVRAAGDLLARAGFTLPVADGDGIDVRYPDVLRLAADLRGMAGGNILAGAHVPIGRLRLAAMAAAFAEDGDASGRIAERFELIYLTGWSPGPDQPAPARRGSGSVSLATVLKPRG